MSLRHSLFASLALFGCASAFAYQSCGTWDPNFASTAYAPMPDGPVYASAVFDSGTGPKLYIGGEFGRIGSTLCRSLACWDGEQWTAVGGAFSGDGAGAGNGRVVNTLAVYDDGSGPALYAGGYFSTGSEPNPVTRIARFDGTSWSIPGGGVAGVVRALTVFDDGTGTKLFAGGRFATAGGVTVNNVARWNGASWSALGSGVQAPANGGVYTLHGHDDGTGAQLYAGGYFPQAGGQPAQNIARWNGSSWSAVGTGFNGDVRALESFDDGSGLKLYAGGQLFVPGQPEYGFHRWDGAGWSGVGGGVIGGPIQSLCAHDDGSGSRLFVGGSYTGTGALTTGMFSAWSAAGWSTVGAQHAAHGIWGVVYALAAHDEGSGTALYAGGYFGVAGDTNASRVARWNGNGWSALGSGFDDGACKSLATFDDGSGPALYAGGEFLYSGGQWVNHVARWSGSSWSSLRTGLGGGFAHVNALKVWDDGTGSALYATGTFSAANGVPMKNIARWNGNAWSALGSGLGELGDEVHALEIFDDGSGPALYAGGRFPIAGGIGVNNIARWNGTSWSALANGVGVAGTADTVHSLCVFDDGSGPALYAGGSFGVASGVGLVSLARWNGTNWSAVPGNLSAAAMVFSLRVIDDGSGPALSVGGRFSSAGGVPASGIARWNGQAWSAVGSGVGGLGAAVLAQEFLDDGGGGGADLFVGGDFFSAGGFVSNDIARFEPCGAVFGSLCAGDGTLAPCPCANSGLSGRGCDNSAATGGAVLGGSGQPSSDSVVLAATGVLPSALTIFLQGQNEVAPVAFGDGLRCVAGSLKRLYVHNASGGAVSAPQAGEPSIRTRSAALGDTIQPGETRRYQAYYRDANLGFCPAPQGSTFNVTNGLSVHW